MYRAACQSLGIGLTATPNTPTGATPGCILHLFGSVRAAFASGEVRGARGRRLILGRLGGLAGSSR